MDNLLFGPSTRLVVILGLVEALVVEDAKVNGGVGTESETWKCLRKDPDEARSRQSPAKLRLRHLGEIQPEMLASTGD